MSSRTLKEAPIPRALLGPSVDPFSENLSTTSFGSKSGDRTKINPNDLPSATESESEARIVSKFERSLEMSANRRAPISDARAIEIADRVNGALWGWFDNDDAALSPLEKLNPPEIKKVNDQFVERHGDNWGMSSLRDLFIDQMSGATLDRALDIVDGFNPARAARLLHEAAYGIFDYSRLQERIEGLTVEQFEKLAASFQEQYKKSLSTFLNGELWDYQVDSVLKVVYGKEAIEVAGIVHSALGSGNYTEAAFVLSSLSKDARGLVESAYLQRFERPLTEEFAQLSSTHRSLIELSTESSPLALEVIKIRQALGFWSQDVNAIHSILNGKNEAESRELRRAYRAVFKEDFLETCGNRLSATDYSKIAEKILRPDRMSAA